MIVPCTAMATPKASKWFCSVQPAARDTMMREYTYDFLKLLAPHLTRKAVEEASRLHEQQQIDALFDQKSLPMR